jgi:insertion element IS1 protein InsB
MVILTVQCRFCESENIRKNGHAPNGKQRYQCMNCSRFFCENPSSPAYSEERKAEILRAYQERSSLRGLTRTFGVSRNTVKAWLKKNLESLPELTQTLIPPIEEDQTKILELDEMWTFVRKKDFKMWLWIVLCRETRQIVAYFLGDRSEASCRQLWDKVPPHFKGGICYSDFWTAYQTVLEKEQHLPVGKETGQTAHVERWYILY